MAGKGVPGPATRLTPKLREELCDLLRRGHYKLAACAYVGIHKDTLNTWENRGKRARALREEGLPVPRTETPYLQLLTAVEHAIDYGEAWLMERALEAIGNPKDHGRWQGYVTILERSRPDRWRRRASAEYADGDKGKPRARLDVSKLTASDRAALRELLEKAADDA